MQGVGAAVDVVVADGGSTDGALEAGFLAGAGVRALLVKTGAGRALGAAADGLCVVLGGGLCGGGDDGWNGKDGAGAIGAIVERLEAGYGYVQGSRYVRGGVAVNTPWDRKVAGRLVHAPLLSLVGRRWLRIRRTGFGGIRRPICRMSGWRRRAVFERYSLLFYLTMRAGQLGYRTCEVPVERGYPAGEATPTKIAGMRGRMAMLGELWDVVRGRYSP